MHTGRSRNDQVATDMHLYTKSEVTELIALIESFQATIVSVAEDNVDTIMPGYTHLQRATTTSMQSTTSVTNTFDEFMFNIKVNVF